MPLDKKTLEAVSKALANTPKNQIPVVAGSLVFAMATMTGSEWFRGILAAVGSICFLNAFLNFNWKLPCKRRLAEAKAGESWPLPICPRDLGYLVGTGASFGAAVFLPTQFILHASKTMHGWGWTGFSLILVAGYAPTIVQGTLRRLTKHDHATDGCISVMLLFSFGWLAGLTSLAIYLFVFASKGIAVNG